MKIRKRLALSALVPFVLSTAAVAEDFWIEEVFQNCAVWSDTAPVDGDVLTWTGGCVGGKASGTGLLIWTHDGALYARYDGAMVTGKLHGRGILIEKSDNGEGFDVVQGAFRDSEPHGRVVIRTADGHLFVGTYDNGVISGPGLWVDALGNSFEGGFVAGVANGTARTVSAAGEIYEGDFINDERHGMGVLVQVDGGVYSGLFENGMMSGLGRFDGAAGVYEGMFADNQPSGPGTFSTADGEILQGRFEDGSPVGQVLVTHSDGSQSIAIWANGKKIK